MIPVQTGGFRSKFCKAFVVAASLSKSLFKDAASDEPVSLICFSMRLTCKTASKNLTEELGIG